MHGAAGSLLLINQITNTLEARIKTGGTVDRRRRHHAQGRR